MIPSERVRFMYRVDGVFRVAQDELYQRRISAAVFNHALDFVAKPARERQTCDVRIAKNLDADIGKIIPQCRQHRKRQNEVADRPTANNQDFTTIGGHVMPDIVMASIAQQMEGDGVWEYRGIGAGTPTRRPAGTAILVVAPCFRSCRISWRLAAALGTVFCSATLNTVSPRQRTSNPKAVRRPLRIRVRSSFAVAQRIMSRKRQGEMVNHIPAITIT